MDRCGHCTFETHSKVTGHFHPVYQCRNVDDCHVHKCAPHGLTSIVSNEIVPEDNKDSDRVSVHLNEHLHVHVHNLANSSNMLYLLLENLRLSLWPVRVDEEAETVEPQSRIRNRSTLLQSKENPQRQKGKKTKKEVGKLNYLPIAKKHKSMDSHEDDEEPQLVPVLPLNQGPAASSQGPAASVDSDDENNEFCDDYSARSQDSGRTVLYPDLFILTNDEHWTVTPETHKYAAAAGSFCFMITANGEQQDFYNLTTRK